jgi:hypothetical protein
LLRGEAKQYQFHSLWYVGLFGYSVSEEKIFLEIIQSETRIACGGDVC